jgi:hypothetical protein
VRVGNSELDVDLDFLGGATVGNAAAELGITLEEAGALTVGELNELFITANGPENEGLFLGLDEEQREAFGLSDEDLAGLTPTEFVQMRMELFPTVEELEFLRIGSEEEIPGLTDLTLAEVNALTVGELNEINIAADRPEDEGVFLGLDEEQREASGLSDEELAELTPAEFLQVRNDIIDIFATSGALDFLGIDSAEELSGLTDLTLTEAEALTVGELNEILIAANGPEEPGIFLGLGERSRGVLGLPDEELADLTIVEFNELLETPIVDSPALDFLIVSSLAQLAEVTDLSLEEVELLNVGELNEISAAAFGPDLPGLFLGLNRIVREATGLSDEELASLTIEEFNALEGAPINVAPNVLDALGFLELEFFDELVDFTELSLAEIGLLNVGELNELSIAINGPEEEGVLFGLDSESREATGLTDEELAELTATEYFDLVERLFPESEA